MSLQLLTIPSLPSGPQWAELLVHAKLPEQLFSAMTKPETIGSTMGLGEAELLQKG